MPLFTGRPLVLQKVQVMPSPHIIFWLIGGMHVNHFEEFFPAITDKDLFFRTIKKHLGTFRTVLQNKKYRCLFNDLQLAIDYEANIHYFDLDRCFESWALKKNPQQIRVLMDKLDTLEMCFQRTSRIVLLNHTDDQLAESFGTCINGGNRTNSTSYG